MSIISSVLLSFFLHLILKINIWHCCYVTFFRYSSFLNIAGRHVPRLSRSAAKRQGESLRFSLDIRSKKHKLGKFSLMWFRELCENRRLHEVFLMAGVQLINWINHLHSPVRGGKHFLFFRSKIWANFTPRSLKNLLLSVALFRPNFFFPNQNLFEHNLRQIWKLFSAQNFLWIEEFDQKTFL